MPETATKPTSKDVPEPTTEEEVEEVPWDDKDVDLLALALQSVGPYFLSNDVRSAESARKVAVLLLEAFLAMRYEQPKPTAEFTKDVAEQSKVYLDELAQQQAGNARLPSSRPNPTPTPTEQIANQRRADDATADKGESDAERRAERLK
jgi:hypothetical protein